MKRNPIETLMGAVVLVVAGVFVLLAYGAANIGAGEGYQLQADFNRATGIAVGSDVRMSGIKIGQVADMSLDPQTYLATVTMTIDNNIRVPADSSIAIANEGLLGGSYLDLAPGGEDTMLAAGSRIEYTQDAVDLVQLLGKAIFASDGQQKQ